MAERTKKRDPGRITKIVKCGVVGDGTVGKTTLLLSYITQAFITEYTPTVFDNFSAIEEVDGDCINVILWDTAGQDDYAQIRTTCYNNCKYDVFLLCYSVIHRDSFDNIKYKWLPELKQNSPGTPFILVGTKTDLRDEKNNQHIPVKEGVKRAKEIKAQCYVECSSRDPASVGKVVMEAVKIVLETDKAMRLRNEKQFKEEKKKEEKEAKKEAKRKQKETPKLNSTGSSSTSSEKGKQKEESP
jgi:small GTP-binding protein